MNSGPGVVWTLLCGMVVALPLTLLHEVGHAIVARVRLGSEVRVRVGNAGRIGTFRLRGVTTTLNLLQAPTRISGVAAFDARRASPQDVLWISIAGPAASLAGGVLLDLAYRHAPQTGAVHALLWTAVLASVFAVANLIPLQLRERRDGPAFKTDGMIAISALATIRLRQSDRADRTASCERPSSPDCAEKTQAPATELGIRVWRHDDHLHLGVGTKHACETGTAATAMLAPTTARGLAHAILRLAEEAEQTTATPKGGAPSTVGPDAGGTSVGPPGLPTP